MTERKVALITGASSGIGASLAREFAKRGYDLVLCARRIQNLEKLSRELVLLNVDVLPIKCDVAQDEDVTRAVETSRARFGRIDVVVGNAGQGREGKVEDLSLGDFRYLFETNIFGVLRIIKETIPDLKKTQGSIGIIGSAMSYLSLPESAPYGMSKAAVKSLAESLRFELRDEGVSVTLLCPGFVATEIRLLDRTGELVPDRKDPIPAWINMPAEKAARQIARAILGRKSEAIITWHAKFIVWMQRHLPSLLRQILNRFVYSGVHK